MFVLRFSAWEFKLCCCCWLVDCGLVYNCGFGVINFGVKRIVFESDFDFNYNNFIFHNAKLLQNSNHNIMQNYHQSLITHQHICIMRQENFLFSRCNHNPEEMKCIQAIFIFQRTATDYTSTT